MRNRNNRSLRKLLAAKGLLEKSVGFDVYGCCCFVEDENATGREEGAGEGEELALARGEVGACWVLVMSNQVSRFTINTRFRDHGVGLKCEGQIWGSVHLSNRARGLKGWHGEER